MVYLFKVYGKDVEEEIKQDTSGLFEDFLVALLNANRYELGIEEEPLTDLALADVAELFAVCVLTLYQTTKF